MDFDHLRKYPRINIDLPVACNIAGKNRRGRIAELGGNGFLLKTSDELALGAELTAKFRPSKESPLVVAHAQVRCNIPGRGLGMEFTAISPENRRIILEVVLSHQRQKRLHPRRPLVVQVVCQDQSFLARSRNISVGGMFVGMKDPLAPGSIATLRFPLDDGGTTIEATGEVRYSAKGQGMGLHFTVIKPEDQSRIDVYVTKGESSVSWPGE